MGTFGIRTAVRFGDDALESLREFAGNRVFVVTDAFLASTDMFSWLRDLLGPGVTVFDGVEPNPTIAQIGKGLAAYLDAHPDVVIAYGGGSPIDAAKAMHKAAIDHGRGAPQGLVVIPTTSGSGSEVTSFSVITDQVTHAKLPMVSPDMVPRLAVLDARVVLGVPPRTTADSGMDVITHAVEAHVSTEANDFSDACAEKSAQLAFAHLERCFEDGHDLEARARMHNASTLAAMAFDNAGLGIVHSLAHALGGRFSVAHGRLNAMLLPHVITYNADHSERAAQRYAWLGQLAGSSAMGTRAGVVSFVSRIERLNAKLGIGPGLQQCGVPAEQVRPWLDELAAIALDDGCTATAPVRPTHADLVRLLRAAL